MGNRAIITFNNVTGLYVHWNGGECSIRSFLKFCELKGWRGSDEECALARLTQVVANFFDDGLSAYVGFVGQMDDSDNGIYRCDGWKIVSRSNPDGRKLEHNPFALLKSINEHQPEKIRLTDYGVKRGAKEIEAEFKAFYA